MSALCSGLEGEEEWVGKIGKIERNARKGGWESEEGALEGV
jgi:hypothetical protein